MGETQLCKKPKKFSLFKHFCMLLNVSVCKAEVTATTLARRVELFLVGKKIDKKKTFNDDDDDAFDFRI